MTGISPQKLVPAEGFGIDGTLVNIGFFVDGVQAFMGFDKNVISIAQGCP
jgi:hypothetical protein